MNIDIFIQALEKFLNVLPILIIAILFSQIINVLVPKDRIKKVFKENEKNIIEASVAGIATPGPLLAYLPFLKALKQKKVAVSLIAAFITGQTLVGPARFFLEVEYFGLTFFIWRVILSFFIAVAVGTSFRILQKVIKY